MLFLPLPRRLDFCSGDFRIVSRSVTRRILKRDHRIAWAEAGTAAVNSLAGNPEVGRGRASVRVSALGKFVSPYTSLFTPPPDLTPDSALKELLSASTLYGDGDTTRVSYPSVGSEPTELAMPVRG